MFGSNKKKALRSADIASQLLLPVFQIVKMQNGGAIPVAVAEDDYVIGYMSGVFFKVWAGAGIDSQSLFDAAMESYFSHFFPGQGLDIVDKCSLKIKEDSFRKYASIGGEELEKILIGEVDNNSLVKYFLNNF
jgi:hypothetical protein